MSVIAKGMEMPKECRDCPFCEYHERTGNTWCKLMDGLIAEGYRPIAFDGRHPDCPLVEADDEEPLVHDGFYLCDKKPGACPSWQKYGWTKCMNPFCNRTSRLDHALELPDDGWIPCRERLPEVNKHVLISRKEWPYPTPDDGDRVFKGMRRKDPRNGEEIWWCYGPGYMADEDVLAWMPLPEPYREDDT